jgi:hypothetical protein
MHLPHGCVDAASAVFKGVGRAHCLLRNVSTRQHTSAFDLPTCCIRRLKPWRTTLKAHLLGDMNDLSDDGHLHALADSDILIN